MTYTSVPSEDSFRQLVDRSDEVFAELGRIATSVNPDADAMEALTAEAHEITRKMEEVISRKNCIRERDTLDRFQQHYARSA